ncbi:MAG: hypothetical protein JF606_00430, partial [Burkholderiales bacterium]|nr:hypothetical protein [Burkholderiales bacterium]
DKLPAQNQAAVLAAASLHQVAVDLRAELRDGFAQAPVRRLQAALRPLLEHAAARENDARALVTDPQWAGCTREVAAWHDAFVTYGNCAATHDEQVATFSDETLQMQRPAVLDLQARISDGMRQSRVGLHNAMDAAHPRLYNACVDLAASILHAEDTATDVSVQLARFSDMAAQCSDIQADLHDSPALQHLRDAGVAPDLQLAHFATLEAICRAMSRPVHHAIDALEKAQEFKGKTKLALDARDENMGELIDELRQKFLEQAVRVQHQAAVDLFKTTKEDTNEAVSTAADLASRVHCILPIDPLSDATAASKLGEASAAQVPSMPAADKAMVDLQRQTANAAIDHRKHALKLPPDVPAEIRAAHETALLVLRHVESYSSTAAEVIDSYHRAFHELRAAAPASQRIVAKQHAESLRKLSARIGNAFGEQISVAPQTERERKAVIDMGSELRQIDQLSETMRLGLEGVGLLFEARRKAQDIKHRFTADDKPRAGALNLGDAEKALNKVYHEAEKWLRANSNNIAQDPCGAAEGATSKNASILAFAYLAWRAEFDRTVAVSVMMRDWLVARLETANSGAPSSLILQKFDGLAIDVTETLTKSNKRAMKLFDRDPQQTRAFLKVTMGLLQDFQNLRSEIKTRLQTASSVPPLPEATAPASLPVDAPAGDSLSDMQHRQGQLDAGTTSRGESSKKKGKSRRTHRRS